MSGRLHDVLFHHADGNAKLGRNLGMGALLELIQQEYLATAKRQFKNGFLQKTNLLACFHDRFLIGRRDEHVLEACRLQRLFTLPSPFSKQIDGQIDGGFIQKRPGS